MTPSKHRPGTPASQVRPLSHRRRVPRVLRLSMLAATVGLLPLAHAQPSDGATEACIRETYGRIPASFEANRGQTDQRVAFLTRGKGGTVFFTPAEVVLALPGRRAARPHRPQELFRGAVLRMRLVGANPRPILVGEDVLPGKSNYFICNDPARW